MNVVTVVEVVAKTMGLIMTMEVIMIFRVTMNKQVPVFVFLKIRYNFMT